MDREKVIKALEDSLTDKKYQEDFSVRFSFEVVEIIITLLKEQETVEPTINEYGEAYCICGENVGIIPNSKNLPKVCLKYCPECGRRMKWHD